MFETRLDMESKLEPIENAEDLLLQDIEAEHLDPSELASWLLMLYELNPESWRKIVMCKANMILRACIKRDEGARTSRPVTP